MTSLLGQMIIQLFGEQSDRGKPKVFRGSYHSVFRLRDTEGKEFTDVLELHIIELRKKLNGTDRIDNWIRLFNAESEEELDMIKTKNVGLLEAIKEVKVMSLSKRMRLRYEARLKEIRDKNAREDYVRQEGWQSGHQEGWQSGHQEGWKDGQRAGNEQKVLELIRLKMAKGQSVEQIAEALEKTPEYILKLMENMDR